MRGDNLNWVSRSLVGIWLNQMYIRSVPSEETLCESRLYNTEQNPEHAAQHSFMLLARPTKLDDYKSKNIFNSLGCLKIRVRDLAGLCRVKYLEFIGAHRQ